MLIIGFVASILILVLSARVASLIIGWDGLGLISYFLVIYYLNKSSRVSGTITVFSNRVGDIFIILYIVLRLATRCGGLDSHRALIRGAVIILVLASITKRAIWPYTVWLPEAIAAPTPVSSLVHSSTLVTAGVYLIIRFSPYLTLDSHKCLIFCGVLALILSSVAAVVIWDFKKIVALSTLRQIRFMIIALAVNAPMLAFFHLLTHAIFKSSLFLMTGTVIHTLLGNQDLRITRGAPQTSWGAISNLLVTLASLRGWPFLAGYFSKELIILYSLQNSTNWVTTFILILAVGFTLTYSIRMLYYIIILWGGRRLRRVEIGSLLWVLGLGLVGRVVAGLLVSSGSLLYFFPTILNDLLWVQVIILFILGVLLRARLKSDLLYKPFYTKFIWLYDFSIQIRPRVLLGSCSKLALHRDYGWLEVIGPLLAQSFISKGVNKIYAFIIATYFTQMAFFLVALLIFIVFE